ncbi:MAG: hypothetical protein N4A48_05700 [Tepidibacter sp.]|jgi:RNA polymerase sporulation-specific sigma factor|uniref:hypothetical protein n=1 Tax=Tepidibacter sp. TaxID=2529387 RepID=UPI0025D61DC4|nr:hypothetical protein [Tepidibacter sp.]MCT4508247.1 hypothetical protein [Tepidibacter sp.]
MKNRVKSENNENSISFLNYISKSIGYKSTELKIKYKKRYSLEELSLNTTKEEMEKINLIVDENNNVEDIALFDEFQDLNDVFENKELVKRIEKLTKKQKNIIYELYVNQITERELAKKLDTSFQNINKVKKTALKKLNKSLLNTNIYFKN